MEIREKKDELVIVDFDEFEAYRIACKIEEDGLQFYEKLVVNVEDSGVSQTLNFLLGEERKHLKFFEDSLSRLRSGREDSAEDNDILTSLDSGVFQSYQSIAELEDIVEDIPKALRLGIAIENKSIGFYQACSENISSTDTKNELALIIAEERKHKDLLETLLKVLIKDRK